MATSASVLASDIATALGHPGDVTSQVLGLATGILGELTQNGTASTGFTPSGHPITGMTGSSMATKIKTAVGYPSVSSQLLGFATGIVSHIQSAADVTYTGPPFIPIPLDPGFYLGGTISGMSGSGMANEIKNDVPFPSVSSILLAVAQAIVDHIQNNAEVTNGIIS